MSRPLIEIARAYACDLHASRGYTYGVDDHGNPRPYSYHLDQTVNIINEYAHLLPKNDDQIIVKCAGWLHDTVEDCGISPNNIIHILGYSKIAYAVAHLVCDVSNPPGMNRVERNLLVYPKIRRNRLAIFVKMADRYANVTESKKNDLDMWATHRKEYPIFRYALKFGVTSDSFLPFWTAMDDIHEYGGNPLQQIFIEATKMADANDKISIQDLLNIFRPYYDSTNSTNAI